MAFVEILRAPSSGSKEYRKLDGNPWEHLRWVTFDKLEVAPFLVATVANFISSCALCCLAIDLMHLASSVHMHLKGCPQEQKKFSNKSLIQPPKILLEYI